MGGGGGGCTVGGCSPWPITPVSGTTRQLHYIQAKFIGSGNAINLAYTSFNVQPSMGTCMVGCRSTNNWKDPIRQQPAAYNYIITFIFIWISQVIQVKWWVSGLWKRVRISARFELWWHFNTLSILTHWLASGYHTHSGPVVWLAYP